MKSLLFLISFLISFNIVHTGPPKCITTENVYYDFQHYSHKFNSEVEWWYLESMSQSYGSFYTDSSLSKFKKIIQLPLYNVRASQLYKNPFSLTYDQVKLKDSSGKAKFNSLIYNEQIVKKVSQGAHSKGFFIWNDEGGIHVIHSNPETPHSASVLQTTTNPGLQHAQHHFCRTIEYKDLNIIAKYIILGDVRVAGINGILHGGLLRFSEIDIDIDKVDKSLDKSSFTSAELNIISNQNKLNFDIVIKFIDDNLIANNNLVFAIKKWVQIAKIVSRCQMTSNSLDNHYFTKIYPKNGNGDSYFIQSTIISLINNYREELHKKTFSSKEKKTYLTRFEKDSYLNKSGYNILYEYVADQYKDYIGKYDSKWTCHTQSKLIRQLQSRSGNLMAYKRNEKIEQVYQFGYEWNYPKFVNGKPNENLFVNSGKDHSKLFYLYAKKKPDESLICFGDLNWQGAQELRGGGLFCSFKMDYVANYLYRHVTVFKDTNLRGENDFSKDEPIPIPNPSFNKYLLDKYKPNSVALVKFDFSEVKEELNILRTSIDLQINVDLNFEIRVKLGESYIPLPGHRVIVYNKELRMPTYTDLGVDFTSNSYPNNYKITYNAGYEVVSIPLLVESITETYDGNKEDPNTDINGFSLATESYSFNVYTSTDQQLYECYSSNIDCDYEDSMAIKLFERSPICKCKYPDNFKTKKREYGTFEWSANDNKESKESFKSTISHGISSNREIISSYLLFMDDLDTIRKSKILPFDKVIKVNENSFESSGITFENLNTNAECFSQSEDSNAIIINYYTKYRKVCLDLLIYCFKQIQEYKDTTDNFSTRLHFFDTIAKYHDKHNLLDSHAFCVVPKRPTGNDPNTNNSNNNLINIK